MKFRNPLLIVTDMERSKTFYQEVLALHVIMDFGANVTLTGGVCLQTKDSWKEFINAENDDIVFGGKDSEIYFEEDDFDQFIEKIKNIEDIQYVHPAIEHKWGQRVVRFYDPDKHIIEVGENMKVVCKRFLDSGMTVEEVAKRMDVPIKFVNVCNR
ncbi:VOC family protein [Caproicibacter fermentans]|uniref:VOC family protein n=1 Tax=Caproicibacter fermentans TaxID=2576756 RepID=A0A7G8TAU1_9FIRM|nr:VOC family protein [Caproicibacter fermentans]QNK40732.1 VOC family protein [Caproicibacter fermentans]